VTSEKLKQLVKNGESMDVEFKGESKGKIPDDDIVKTVVCMANRPGTESGWILIGVEDNGAITGAHPEHVEGTAPYRLQALIANRTHPPLSVRVHLILVDNVTVIALEVPPTRSPVGTTSGLYLRRTITGKGTPSCIPMQPTDFESLQASRGLLDYSRAVLPTASWDDLDPLEFERFRKCIQDAKTHADQMLRELSDEELAKALGAVEANHEVHGIRVLGLLLFGKEESLRRLLPTHEVAFQVLAHERVQVNDFFHTPLLRTMDELLQRFRARYQEEEISFGMFRIPVPEYSEPAFREAVANALIHRDYTRLGAVHIQWYPDKIVISNPGGFPEGVRLTNILVTPPRPRNPLLADAFKRAGIVERTGRGVDIIFREQLRNGRPAPSYDQTTETDVVLVLPGGKANLAFVRLVSELNRDYGPLTLDELFLLNTLERERSITTTVASERLQKPESEIRPILERLVEHGLIERSGVGKARRYHLSASTYRRLGLDSAYLRQKDFEPIQQKQLILDYVKEYGKITRSQAAKLCKISPSQATRLLKQLVNEGLLTLHGTRKGSFYTRAHKI
jgi:ATP-dependent DNA helicase RecG